MTISVARWGPGFALVGTDTRQGILTPDGGSVATYFDWGGKIAPLRKGWIASTVCGEYAEVVARHQVADLRAASDLDEESIGRILREGLERHAPRDTDLMPYADAEDTRIRHYVALTDGEAFYVGRFNARGETDGAWGRMVTVGPSRELKLRDDAPEVSRELRDIAMEGEGGREAVDAAVACIHRAAELADDVSPEALVGVVYRAPGGEIHRHFERERS